MTTKTEDRQQAHGDLPGPGLVGRLGRGLLTTPIRFYQVAISPYRNRTCRYYPTCSQYALTALKRHGVFKGTYLAARRLLRCHPWTPGGVDHVPGTSTDRSEYF